MTRKNCTLLFVLFIPLFFSSCLKKDNYDGPDASLAGTIFVDGSNNHDTVQTCTGNFSIRLYQLDWSNAPAPQDIPVKIDGTYQNTKLFSGRYSVSIHGGAFWPIESDTINIKQGTHQDFQLIPYLFVNNLTAQWQDTTLVLGFSLATPIDGIPKITEIDPFVNTTRIVGPGASIQKLSAIHYIKDGGGNIGKDWADFSDADKDPQILIPVPTSLTGRTFFVRVGVRFDNDDKSFNLSDVIEVSVP